MRRICYVTGTRADFGLMRRTLQAIAADPGLALDLLVTGMHLDPAYGGTVREIGDSGLAVRAEVPVPLAPATGATMARNIARALLGFTDALADRPDLVLLLGDRGEMLAGALAALHLNIPIAHVHGGERSGTLDEPIRHAVSKLSHLHFTATEGGRERLVRMGEDPANVHVVGAPGLDGLEEIALTPRDELMADFGLDPARPFALMVYHPVVQEAAGAGDEAATLLGALQRAGTQVLALMPNSDAGSAGVRAAIEAVRGEAGIAVATHLERGDFVSAMAAADVMAGNSSAGIIEAASFGTPVVNVGTRQTLRERNANVIDSECDAGALRAALAGALDRGRYPPYNVYGDGRAAARIVALLRDTPIGPELMRKINAY
jgi:GDP/UDP-N,N'-diacetylbacillosamine 2-epimerase (hydrolysing)